MEAGRIAGELPRQEATEQRILELAMTDNLVGAATGESPRP
jgi:L-arabinose transport system ATP-binding protein